MENRDDSNEYNSFLSLLAEADAAALDKTDFKKEIGPITKLVQDKVATVSKVLDKQTSDVRKEAAQRDVQLETEDKASSAFVAMLEPNEVVEYRRPGVQPLIIKKLKRGEYIEADFIDLHGKTLDQAYEAVMRFIGFAKQHEFRCILIIHGKGVNAKPKALIKSHVVHWLKQIPEVLAFHSAPEWKGGTGAVMIILKKGEKAYAETREEYSRR